MAPSMNPNAPVEALKILPNKTHQNWLKDRGLRKLNLGIAFMFASSAGTGYNGSLMNGLLVLPEFAMIIGGLKPTIVGLLIAATSLGAFFAFTPASYIADTLGRKWCVGVGCCLVIISSVMQIFVQSHWAFFGCRVLAGAGVGTAQTAAPLLATEIAHPRQRQTATALYNACWCIGSITSAAGKNDEALVILAKYHANGDKHDELVQHEFHQICNTISIEALEPRSWGSFFSSKGDVHRLVICVMVGLMQEWAGNGIISYYLAPILASVGVTRAADQASVNVGLQVWNLFLSAGGAVASERYGRRILWLLGTMIMLFFLSLMTIVAGVFQEKHIAAAGLAVVPMIFLFFSGFNLAYSPLFIAYPAEILPFPLRAKGMAITLSTDAVACFFNQYVNPVAFSAIQWKYYLVYVGCLTWFLVTVYFLFPETKGRSLEEVSRIFDRKEVRSEDSSDTKTEG
ncbi:Lactose permease [Penicillium subrubescens]|uniref:Lactose permease n=1 Tax=Penicillium subrubescens TaxID=1316194 RepID=A0A1Q5TFD0_9EURO|nr:Lactose permease [Penicillium subrubescens]